MSEFYRSLDAIDLGEIFPRELMPAGEERAAVNDLYPAFVFFREAKSGREIFTSCCQRHIGADDRTIPPLYDAAYLRHNDLLRCPFCGAQATMKEIRYLRSRKKLEKYIPVAFLREVRGELWALAAWTRKLYAGELTDEPEYHVVGVYHFAPGTATKYEGFWGENSYSNICAEKKTINPKNRQINEPFTDGSGCTLTYEPYYVAGLDAIERSDFRYCQYELFHPGTGGLHGGLMKCLAACCVYPRDIEMLMKCGADELVRDLVSRRTKNTKIYRWGASDPRKAFGLDGQELREWRESGADVYQIAEYKRLKREGRKTSFPELAEIKKALRYDYNVFLKEADEQAVKPAALFRYFRKQAESGAFRTELEAFIYWQGYIRAAEALGWSLDEKTVRFPRELRRRHDEATQELNMKAARERAEKERRLIREAAERQKARRKKYNLRMDGYLIRVAETPEEIREEGKTLEHCVGGYAERHMAGKTTILFLRDEAEPDAPLVTIEMDGDRLVQIHGYKNERYKGAEDPRITYKDLLSVWLDWIKRGSPRNKAGEPRLKKKGKKAA